jgi:hypothetical protein
VNVDEAWSFTQGATISCVMRVMGRPHASLVGAVIARASVMAQLPTDGGLVRIQHLGDLRLIMSCFHGGANLIAFSLADVFVGHKQLRLSGHKALNAKHPQPPETVN